jgi:hypothetical protein
MAASLHDRALRCLAQREHSRAELARKLGSLGEADEVKAELDRLTELGLLSDARFADAYVRAKAARFGASRLRLELSRRGVNAEQITTSLEDNCGDGELERARDILHQLESGEDQGAGRPAALLDDLPLFRAAAPIPAPAAPAKTAASAVEDRLRGLNPDAISAREALNLLYELREMLPESPAGSAR